MAVILGGNDTLPQITLTQSQTWVPPQDGNICIHVIGGGGAGLTHQSLQRGGGAGGYSKKNSLAVTTSGSYTVVVGVGGPRTRNAATPSAGGNSTVAGTGLSATLTANGGGAANTGGTSGSGSGGTASGGDVNNTGGAGAGGSGGGAVGVYGTGDGPTSEQLRGGQSDASGGGLPMSGFGQIVGGNAGAYQYAVGNQSGGGHVNAGDLSGGGNVNSSGTGTYHVGGNGGIGGGGGGVASYNGAAYAIAGAGGDGLVLIQYLPS